MTFDPALFGEPLDRFIADILVLRLNTLIGRPEAKNLINAIIEQRVPVESDVLGLIVFEDDAGKLSFGTLGLINSLLTHSKLVAHYDDTGELLYFTVKHS